jgi:hypothetical protein
MNRAEDSGLMPQFAQFVSRQPSVDGAEILAFDKAKFAHFVSRKYSASSVSSVDESDEDAEVFVPDSTAEGIHGADIHVKTNTDAVFVPDDLELGQTAEAELSTELMPQFAHLFSRQLSEAVENKLDEHFDELASDKDDEQDEHGEQGKQGEGGGVRLSYQLAKFVSKTEEDDSGVDDWLELADAEASLAKNNDDNSDGDVDASGVDESDGEQQQQAQGLADHLLRALGTPWKRSVSNLNENSSTGKQPNSSAGTKGTPNPQQRASTTDSSLSAGSEQRRSNTGHWYPGKRIIEEKNRRAAASTKTSPEDSSSVNDGEAVDPAKQVLLPPPLTSTASSPVALPPL